MVELTVDPGALEPYSSELRLKNAKFSDTGTFTCRSTWEAVKCKKQEGAGRAIGGGRKDSRQRKEGR